MCLNSHFTGTGWFRDVEDFFASHNTHPLSLYFFFLYFQNDAVFTYYPIVTFTEASKARDRNAQVEAAGVVALGFGANDQWSAVGDDRLAAGEGILAILAPGVYNSAELSCGVKEHPQMHVRIGVLMEKTGAGMKAKGKLQLLDVRKISGNKILVLRRPRLSMPVAFGTVDWPCDAKQIIQLGRPADPREPAAPVEPAPGVALQGLIGRLWVPLLFAILAVAVFFGVR